MIKIFWYELRRTVRSRTFCGPLAVCLFFGWTTLRTATIRGVAHTAPFSPWSFGSYLAQLLPLLAAALLFFLWGQCNASARRLELLADATPADPGQFLLARCAAVAAAWLLLALAVVLLGLGFLLGLFGGQVPLGELALAAVVALVPPLALLLGLGLLLGRLHSALPFVLLPLALLTGLLPEAVQLFGEGFFSRWPLALGVLDPAFALPPAVLAGRLSYALLGVLLLSLALRRRRRTA